VDAPALAPFTPPAKKQSLSNPASLANLDLDSGMSDIEKSFLQMQSQAVVETALKRSTKLRDIPLTVSWIPEEELQGTGEFTLCDSIQYFPGMECRRGAMRKVAVSARGLGSNFLSNRLLLLSDGRPDTDPWTAQFYADETYPLANVKQIEVIRGPGSSLYGSNAFSGVINVIHRSPSDLIKDGRDYGVDARFLAGQNNTFRLDTTVAGRVGALEALVNYYGFKSDGAELLNDPSAGIVDHNEWSQVQQVSGKVQWHGVSLDAAYTDSQLGRPGGNAISQVGNCGRCHFTPDDAEYSQVATANLQADEKVNDWLQVFGQVYTLFKRRQVDLKNLVTDELQPSLGKRNRVGAEVRGVGQLGGLAVTVGSDVKHDTVNNQNTLAGLSNSDTRETIFGAYVDGEYHVTDRLVVGAGARVDYYSIPDALWTNKTTQISPRASIVFHALPELTLRTNYGRAFRAPSMAELAINQQMYASTLLGNPALKAETLDTVEAAVDVWPAKGAIRLTATGFYNRAENLINQVFLFGSTSQFQNIGNARVVGFEGEVAAQIQKIHSSVDLAYQYLDAVNQPTVGGSEQLDFAPHHRIYLRARTRLTDRIFAEFYGLYVGSRYDPSIQTDSAGNPAGRIKLPGYLSANMRIGADIIDGLSASLVATNVFNSSYEEMHGFPVAPFNAFAEFRYAY
jgi:outer membrane receptor protein involved in Fe transport